LDGAGNDAPAALPLAVVDTSKGVVSFTWTQLLQSTARVPISNTGKDPVKVTARSTMFYRDPPADSSEASAPEELTLTTTPLEIEIPPNTTQPFTVSADEKAIPGNYSGFLVIEDRSGKLLKSAMIQIHITVNGPQPLVSKLTVKLLRLIPAVPWYWSRGLTVPLRDNAQDRVVDGTAIGVVRSDNGGWVPVRWKGIASGAPDEARLEVDPPPAARKYDGDLKLAGPSAPANLTLTVLIQDCVFWPICVLALGTWMAFWVKRYLGVLRVTWTLRAREAELGGAYRDSQERFAASAEGQPFAADSLDDDLANRRKALLDKIASLERSNVVTQIGPDNTDYKAAVKDLQDLQDAIAAWGGLGADLSRLAQSLDEVRTSIDGADLVPPADTPDPPPFVETASPLLKASPIKVKDVVDLCKTVAQFTTLAKRWRSGRSDAASLTSGYRALRVDFPTDPAAEPGSIPSRLDALRDQLAALWVHVQEVKTPEHLTGIDSDLDSARTALQQIRAALPQVLADKRVLGMREESSQFLADEDALTGGTPPAVADHRRELLLRARIQQGDLASTLFAGAVALLTGLNAYYLGKPFGSLADYMGLFLWAAGTKASLDILSAVWDRFVTPKANP
jgi:hypothetical protein